MQLRQCARDGLRDGTADVPAQPNKSRVEMNCGKTVAKRGVVDGLTYQRVGVQINQEVGGFDVDQKRLRRHESYLADTLLAQPVRDGLNGWHCWVSVCVDELHRCEECVSGGIGPEPRHGLDQAATKVLGGIPHQETSVRIIKPIAPGTLVPQLRKRLGRRVHPNRARTRQRHGEQAGHPSRNARAATSTACSALPMGWVASTTNGASSSS